MTATATDRPTDDTAWIDEEARRLGTAAAPNGASATLTRAVVSIATVRVGPKQMTKAVYGQLPETDLDRLRERGDVWGWVNACPSGCLEPAPGTTDTVLTTYATDGDSWVYDYHGLYGKEEERRVDPRHRHYVGSIAGTLYRATARYYLFRGGPSIDYQMLDGRFVSGIDGNVGQLFIAV